MGFGSEEALREDLLNILQEVQPGEQLPPPIPGPAPELLYLKSKISQLEREVAIMRANEREVRNHYQNMMMQMHDSVRSSYFTRAAPEPVRQKSKKAEKPSYFVLGMQVGITVLALVLCLKTFAF